MWAPRYFHLFGHALEAVPEEQRRLGLVLFLVALAHGLAFFAFSVVTPSALPAQRAKTHVVLYSSASSAAPAPTLADFGFWSRINDPSLPIYPPDLMEGTGRPRSAPRWPSAAAEAATVAVASDFDFLPDRLAPLPQRAEEVLAPPPPLFNYRAALFRPSLPATTVEWSAALAGRRQGLPAWSLPDAPVNLLAESGVTVLRLAVDARGHVLHAVVDQSSGRSEIDRLALDGARGLHFAPAPNTRPVWGRATVFWRFTPPPATP